MKTLIKALMYDINKERFYEPIPSDDFRDLIFNCFGQNLPTKHMTGKANVLVDLNVVNNWLNEAKKR